ncbi:GtrA family protein [Serratia sp. IR-2025]|uniref:GtrA family protein n=1 Tax=Serratia nevei TaxID=2703794 RepID=UPI00285CF129|nr:GtrA family protein [Serratia nevei]MBX9336421.1 GtrA family protein [Serratia marcescens]MDR8480564.1 GtrA family protein [Serratia nevei]
MKIFIRYASVGLVNTLVHWAVFAVMFTNGAQQVFSNFVAFCIAVTVSFFANARWTFNANATTIRYMMYVFFMGAMASIIGWLADCFNIKPILTLVVFSAISLVCGFIYSKYIIFKEDK